VTDHDHQSPSAPDRAGSADPYAAPTATPGAAPAAWTVPSGAYGPPPPAGPQPLSGYATPYGPPPPAGPQSWSGYATPYGPSPDRAPGPRTTNPWAMVALITGILPLVPIAIGSGIAALVQINRTRQCGKVMAVSGLVMATVWTVIGVLSAVGAATGMFSDSSTSLTGRIADAGSTTVGHCLAEPSDVDSIATEIDCNKAHFAEVYRAQTLKGTRWPGYDKIDQSADDLCSTTYIDYVGTSYEQSTYSYDYYVPDQAEWLAGEHRVICVVVPGDQDTLQGSVRDSRN
jgi:Septum formation